MIMEGFELKRDWVKPIPFFIAVLTNIYHYDNIYSARQTIKKKGVTK